MDKSKNKTFIGLRPYGSFTIHTGVNDRTNEPLIYAFPAGLIKYTPIS